MRIIIRYESGRTVEGVVLAMDRERMRIAFAAENDTIELHRVDRGWHTENADAVEIESMSQIPGLDASAVCSALYPVTAAAGGRIDL